jgi:hypothetical protein
MSVRPGEHSIYYTVIDGEKCRRGLRVANFRSRRFLIGRIVLMFKSEVKGKSRFLRQNYV